MARANQGVKGNAMALEYALPLFGLMMMTGLPACTDGRSPASENRASTASYDDVAGSVEAIGSPASSLMSITYPASDVSYPEGTSLRFDIVWTGLPPGTYQFVATGVDDNGTYITGAAVHSIRITASPHTYHVATTGNDISGDGSALAPWRTLEHATQNVTTGDTIELAAGTFVEDGPIEVPAGINITGAGKALTTLEAASSFYHHPSNPGYALDKYLIRLASSTQIDGNQTLKGFTIDGDGRQLHGGIFVNNRNNVTLQEIEVTSVNFNGIWLWDVQDQVLRDVSLVNTSWGSTDWVSGALQLGNVERVLIEGVDIDEDRGYGIKAIGPSGSNKLYNVVVRSSQVSVTPDGLWNNGMSPNIAIEYWNADMKECEIGYSYIDNVISLVSAQALLGTPVSGTRTIRVHQNTIDLTARAAGHGYAIELTTPDVEIDNNYIVGGDYGITNWGAAVSRWQIHHNTFYNQLSPVYPGDIVRAQSSGLHEVLFSNNTIEFDNDKTMQVIGLHGGSSDSVHIINNLIIDSNPGAYNYYPTAFLHLENGAVISDLRVENNLLWDIPIGSVPGTYHDNITTQDPQIQAYGPRPHLYYRPLPGSPLIDAGLDVGYTYLGAAPNIGAYE
jgi:hypothetical protein